MRANLSHIRDHLRVHKIARDLLERDRREQELATTLRSLLPETLREHCLDVVAADGKLTLFLDSPAWVTRARFLSEEIRISLTSSGVSEIRFQVRLPERPRHASGPRDNPIRRLSDKVVSHLLEAADHQADPGLSAAFRRIAQRHAAKPTEGGR